MKRELEHKAILEFFGEKRVKEMVQELKKNGYDLYDDEDEEQDESGYYRRAAFVMAVADMAKELGLNMKAKAIEEDAFIIESDPDICDYNMEILHFDDIMNKVRERLEDAYMHKEEEPVINES